MNIDNIPAGKEMDQLIAEKVTRFILTKDGYIRLYDADTGLPTRNVMKCPNYSTDIADAWKAFKEILDPNRISIHPRENGQEGLWWAVYFDDEMITHANTAPLAICRAALKTRGII